MLKNWLKKRVSEKGTVNSQRRGLLSKIVVGSGLLATASHLQAKTEDDAELRFPGDPVENNVVYQFNKADEEYHKAVLFSVGAMLRKYGDNIKIVVTCIGPGLHILAKNPKRPVSAETKQRVSSLAQYGVEFHACGNTMKSLKWEEKDMLDFASIVEVGAADLMELQQQGFAYISW
ncbi:MAG: DsrE family protein [Gammaproteobacteria bacterium]|nr:DsrE family protein [Gammaproteobacteria bacterium]MDH5729765.1 DsrE family protein [Gammaproteobacteria bacterium]